jgi:hypothetical protein
VYPERKAAKPGSRKKTLGAFDQPAVPAGVIVRDPADDVGDLQEREVTMGGGLREGTILGDVALVENGTGA